MSALIDFIASHRAEFIARLGEHVVLVLASTAIAAALGIPLGILAARKPSLAKPIVALANLAQTIPSLVVGESGSGTQRRRYRRERRPRPRVGAVGIPGERPSTL